MEEKRGYLLQRALEPQPPTQENTFPRASLSNVSNSRTAERTSGRAASTRRLRTGNRHQLRPSVFSSTSTLHPAPLSDTVAAGTACQHRATQAQRRRAHGGQVTAEDTTLRPAYGTKRRSSAPARPAMRPTHLLRGRLTPSRPPIVPGAPRQ